jgi:GntR family transcriptional regulator
MVRDDSPKYVRLAAKLRELINDGTYAPGSELPTVVQLKEANGVTIATVQEAMRILKREGLIDSTQGRRSKVLKQRCIIGHSASYVAPDPDGRRMTWKQQLAALGMEGTQRLGRVGEVPAPEDIAELFNIAPGDPVLLRPRVMYADDEAVQVADSYYPIEIASGTPLAQQKLVKGGSIAVLTEAGYPPVDCVEELTFPLPGPEEREKLGVDPEARVVRMVRTVLAGDDQPVEVHVMTLKADRHRLTYRLPVHG